MGGKAWYTLFAHAPNFPDIPLIQTRKVYASATELPECRENLAHAQTVCTGPSATRLTVYKLVDVFIQLKNQDTPGMMGDLSKQHTIS